MKFSLKKETCQYICTIFSVLVLSIFIRILFNNQFEHFSYGFTLKFTQPTPQPTDPTMNDFDFKIGTITGRWNTANTELSFDMQQPTGDIILTISKKPNRVNSFDMTTLKLMIPDATTPLIPTSSTHDGPVTFTIPGIVIKSALT